MTADRTQYFEERLKKPIPEPFKSWMEELFAEAKGKPQAKPAFKASKSLSIRHEEPEPTTEG